MKQCDDMCYNDNTAHLSLLLLSLILSKTRFVSHIYFIGRCLSVNVIPVGFRVKFNSSNFGVNVDKYRADISSASNSFSRSVMRSTIRTMCAKRQALTLDITQCITDLSNVCPLVLVTSIRSKIRELNHCLYESLSNTKRNKLASLTGVTPTSHNHNHIDVSRSVVTIPQDLPLSDVEKSVLSKGLNFIPISKKSDQFQVNKDAESFLRRVRLQAFFANVPNNTLAEKDVFQALNPRKSNWVPPDGQFPAVDLFVNKCRRDIRNINFDRKLNHSNLTKEEWSALHSLRNRRDVVIKPADKGGAVVVWRADLYKEEALRQLSDTNFYSQVDKDLTPSNQKLVKETINSFIADGSLPPTAKNLFVVTPRTSHIYFLPKIHKPNNPGRPIVSACSCPTELISNYLDALMLPIVQSLPTYIKDTNHALRTFNDFHFLSDSKLLFTMDVKSLYTVIPHNEGLLALKHFFDRRTTTEPSTSTLLRLAELVLTLNCFSFDDQYFKQTNGVAMGTRMGPSYANLFVGHIEELIFTQYTGPKPDFFGRYIDDCIGITSCTRSELDSFILFVDSFHPSLQFTWEISDTSVAFLDISVSISGNRLSTSVYYKPTDSHSYLSYSSSHPKHTLDSIPYSQFLRLRRLCSDDVDFADKCQDMCSFFLNRNYPHDVVSRALAKVSDVSRESALVSNTRTTNNRIPFTVTYHPLNNAVKPIVNRNFNLLNSDLATSNIFSERPLFSFKRDRNLRNFLVRGVLPSNKEPGTFRCSRSRCNTCRHIVSRTSITGPKSSHRIIDHFDCITPNVIYCIQCTVCNLLYVGETGRRLGDRIRDHIRDIGLNDVNKPVSRHFNSANHNISHMIVFGLCVISGANDDRKTKEMRLIHSLGTQQPLGMNERFSFN